STVPAVIYGDTDIVDDEGRFLRKRHLRPPRQLTWQSFKDGMLVCHQAFFARTDIARQNLYNLRYRFSADYDWCIRVMKQGHALGLPMVNADIVVADYLDGGMTVKNHRRSLMERLRIMAAHYGWLTALARHAGFVFRALKRRIKRH
ncbi:MAG: glycosyltransferase, partial [Bacteroidales bacterium]|nr:glycosyltransferase [Bacteroidales bacterium]